MAKTRMISSKFWADGWVRKINPLDRYLFMYFLTNEHTNICGIYELPIETMAFETGIEKEELVNSMLPRLEPKVYYIDGWVCIPNFPKHQSSEHPNVKKGIENALGEIPGYILEKAQGRGYRLARDPIASVYLDSDLDLDLKGESGDSTPSFEEYLESIPGITTDYEGDGEVSELVYRLNGKKVSVKTLLKDYEKAHPTPSKRPLNAPRTRVWVNYDVHLEELKNSSKKEDKIVALIWKEKGYRFENYEQWRAQMGRDAKYIKDLVGYSGQQISDAIERCRRDAEKGGYDWKASTVAKKIAETTI